MDQIKLGLDGFSLDFLTRQINGLYLGWSMLWGWGVGPLLAAVAVLPGLFVRLKAKRADAWYVVMYFGMLLVWPWPGHMGRFLWPLLPCFLVSAHSSFELLKSPKHQSVGSGVLMAIILATAIPDGIGRSLERLLDPPKGELSQLSRMHEWTRSSSREEGLKKLKERQQLLQDLQRVSEIVNTKACIYSDMPALVAVQTRRVSYPLLWTSLDDVGLRKISCEYYYMIPGQLPGTNIEDLNRFAATHEELFRSEATDDPVGKLPFSVFLRFSPASAK